MNPKQVTEPRREADQTVRLPIDTKNAPASIRISFTDQRWSAHGGMIVWSHFLHQPKLRGGDKSRTTPTPRKPRPKRVGETAKPLHPPGEGGNGSEILAGSCIPRISWFPWRHLGPEAISPAVASSVAARADSPNAYDLTDVALALRVMGPETPPR